MGVDTNTLESLPIDIKFSILTQLGDFRSLYSLCEASPVFASIYDTHQNLIDGEVCVRDALNYRREALWLAVYRNRLYTFKPSGLQVLQSVAEYKSYPRPPTCATLREELETATASSLLRRDNVDPDAFTAESDVQFKYRNYSRYPIGKKEIDSMARTHRTVLEIYQRFTKTEILNKYRASRSPHAREQEARIEKISGRHRYCLATGNEERRIVTAIYRLLFIVNLYFHLPGCFKRILQDWGLWANIHIRAVRDFLVDEVEKVAEEIPDDRNIEWINSLYEGSSHYGDVVGLLLLHDLPDYQAICEDNSPLWSPTQLKRQLPFLHVRTDDDVLRISEKLNIPFWGNNYYASYSLYFMDVSGWDKDGKKARDTCIPGLPLRVPRGKTFLRRGEGNGFCVYVVFGNDGHPTDSIMDQHFAIDLKASIWDSWRLNNWGYKSCDWQLSRYPGCCFDCADLSYGLDGECGPRDSDPYFAGFDYEEDETPERFGIKRENYCKGKRSKGTKSAKGMRPKIPGKAMCKKRFDGGHDELGDLLDRKLDLDL
ncbi:hypothetical protein TWF506_000403 [Arthrobotrys conoides]|uniref:F-box domain-containing protein n=1 Tax=Arthrobotrys conoides TaxID=74498 RepID=A0AAN8NVE3_9PEZI